MYDGKGVAAAVGVLGAGRPAGPGNTSLCQFPVRVQGVPSGSAFYSVQIAGRPQVRVSAADAEAGRFAATLG